MSWAPGPGLGGGLLTRPVSVQGSALVMAFCWGTHGLGTSYPSAEWGTWGQGNCAVGSQRWEWLQPTAEAVAVEAAVALEPFLAGSFAVASCQVAVGAESFVAVVAASSPAVVDHPLPWAVFLVPSSFVVVHHAAVAAAAVVAKAFVASVASFAAVAVSTGLLFQFSTYSNKLLFAVDSYSPAQPSAVQSTEWCVSVTELAVHCSTVGEATNSWRINTAVSLWHPFL